MPGESVGGTEGTGAISFNFSLASTLTSTMTAPVGSRDYISPASQTGTTTATIQPISLDPPNLSLLSCLTLLSSTNTTFTYDTTKSQAANFELFRTYLLGVATYIDTLEKLLSEIQAYYKEATTLTSKYTGLVYEENKAHQDYDVDVENTARSLSVLKSAQATYNSYVRSNSVLTGAGIDIGFTVAYYGAVNSYNDTVRNNFYRLSVISQNYNETALAYNTQLSSFNASTANINAQLSALNASAVKLGLGIPLVSAFPLDTSPKISYFNATTDLPSVVLPGTGSINTFAPNGYAPSLNTAILPQVQIVASTFSFPSAQYSSLHNIEANVLLPLYSELSSALASILSDISNQSAYDDLLYYTLQQGTNLSPAAINSFLENTPVAQFKGTTGGSPNPNVAGGGLGQTSNPGVVSTGLYIAVSQNFQANLPQKFFAKLNGLTGALLTQLGLSAGANAVQNLGATINNLQPGGTAITVAVAANLLQNIIALVSGSQSTTAPAIAALLTSADPNLTTSQINGLVTAFSSAQNISLLLYGVLALSLATRTNSFLNDIAVGLPGLSSSSGQNSNLTPTASSVLNNSLTQLLLKAVLASSLTENTSLNESTITNAVNKAVNAVVNNLNPNQTAAQLQQQFEQQFTAYGLGSEASSLASLAVNLLNSQTSTNAITPATTAATTVTPTVNTTADVSKLSVTPAPSVNAASATASTAAPSTSSVSPTSATAPSSTANPSQTGVINNAALNASLINTLTPELGTAGATALANSITQVLDNPTNPYSLTNLLQQNKANLAKLDQKTRDEVDATVNAFVPTSVSQAVEPSVMLRKILDPSYNITASYMTGPMWDKGSVGKPHGWRRPLEINV